MAYKKDLSVMVEDVKLNVRVGAFIKYQNKILVERNKNVDFGVIPGGRIQTLESSHVALVREIYEELGIDLSDEKLEMISMIENFFEFDNKKYHELYLVYKIELGKDYGIKDGMVNLDNEEARYYFLDMEEFQRMKILPEILKEIVLEDKFRHYVVDDLRKDI